MLRYQAPRLQRASVTLTYGIMPLSQLLAFLIPPFSLVHTGWSYAGNLMTYFRLCYGRWRKCIIPLVCIHILCSLQMAGYFNPFVHLQCDEILGWRRREKLPTFKEGFFCADTELASFSQVLLRSYHVLSILLQLVFIQPTSSGG